MRLVLFLFLAVFITSCDGPEPRKPIQTKSGSFFKASIERSRKLLEAEENKIQAIIELDSLKHYAHSNSGSWYHYLTVNEDSDYTPKTDDLVVFNYDILTLDNDTIYSKEDIGVVTYKVDKQEIFLGLRDAIKMLKVNERATFLFPSSIAFGYHGDENKIGSNVPLKSTITILQIEKQEENTVN
ncbi:MULTISPECIES: gliding motility-associated peptidyl-prolyl isomerase GldI [Maribacter]|jgi:gliding motility-associated peptidyl-prolyl isomerase|uniref:Peptidyl-prolyl cis-trans isomerase n=1 Tax=Maribacter stanieri TaxID=440514 RepID=A0A1I6JR92_9FLAO|nr:MULTISPECIES: gliding motility-associated peptidyl-prolyl isomerase GldI [Maribacter]SFR81438.1 protein involved in gliding motility GldI [Maribacter stanieri]|tara:strand:- start:1191 stop:1742 length:552 start_codon:yes stop_codon:yes gene_type:complete